MVSEIQTSPTCKGLHSQWLLIVQPVRSKRHRKKMGQGQRRDNCCLLRRCTKASPGLLTFHCPGCNHVVLPCFKGTWEMQYLFWEVMHLAQIHKFYFWRRWAERMPTVSISASIPKTKMSSAAWVDWKKCRVVVWRERKLWKIISKDGCPKFLSLLNIYIPLIKRQVYLLLPWVWTILVTCFDQ